VDGWWTTLWEQAGAPVQWLVVVVIATLAAATDVRSGRIPNALTLPAFVLGLIWAGASAGWLGLADALAGAAAAMLPFVFMFAFAGGGAGDAKLMAAIGAWLGVIGGVLTLGAVLAAGALIAIVTIIVQRNHRLVGANFVWILSSLRVAVLDRGEARRAYVLPPAELLHTLPYGLAIFVGTCLASGGFLLCRYVV
jgi:prepilin peptidase CpaA